MLDERNIYYKPHLSFQTPVSKMAPEFVGVNEGIPILTSVVSNLPHTLQNFYRLESCKGNVALLRGQQLTMAIDHLLNWMILLILHNLTQPKCSMYCGVYLPIHEKTSQQLPQFCR